MSPGAESSSSTIKSVNNAFVILEIVARNNGPMPLKTISSLAKISPSKAHRYLQSLCACGLLNQAQKSGAYDLGVSALRLGLSAVNRVDIVNRAGDELSGLANSLDADVILTVWTDLGPTVVRYERSKNPSLSMVGPGVAFPALNSATGLVFLAYGAPALVEEAMRREAGDKLPMNGLKANQLNDRLAQVRSDGFACMTSSFIEGRQGVAAPILSLDDKIVAAITYVRRVSNGAGPDMGRIDRLLAFCNDFSLQPRGFLEETPMTRAIAV